eukprot:symbB.v1.2.018637.t1/scaffold1496.1/size115469/1
MVERGAPLSMAEVQCSGQTTMRQFAQMGMEMLGKTFQHYAVRVGTGFVELDELVVNHFTQNHKVVFIHLVEPGRMNDETFAQKLQDAPLTIYIRGGPASGRFEDGFYPAYPKMTVLQWMEMIEAIGAGAHGGEVENMWFLDNNGEPSFLNEQSRKQVRSVLKDKTTVVYNYKMENTADMGSSPIFSPCRWQPTTDTHMHLFQFGPIVRGVPHRPVNDDGSLFNHPAPSDDTESSSEEEFEGLPPPNVLGILDGLDDMPLQSLKNLQEKCMESVSPILKLLLGLDKEFVRRGHEAMGSFKVDDIKVVFPSGEPEDEPEDEVIEEKKPTSDLPRSSTEVVPEVAPPAQAAQTTTPNSVAFRFNSRTYDVSMDGLKTLGQFRDRCGIAVGGIKGKDLRLTKENGSEIFEKNAIHLTTLGIVAGVVINGTFRGRGGARKSSMVKANPQLKQHTMAFKDAIMKEKAERAKSIRVDDLEEVLKKSSEFLNQLYAKLHTNPKDTFAKLISTMPIEKLEACIECFKSNKTETRIHKLCAIIMKHHIPRLYTIKEEFDHALDAVQTFFDLLMSASFMGNDLQWGWNDAKVALTHMRDMKKSRVVMADASSLTDASGSDGVNALTTALENTRMEE